MPRRIIDLNDHLNQTVTRGADFPVSLQPVFLEGGKDPIPNRRAVVREDTGQAIAVVSHRYTLVPHSRILDIVEEAIRPLDVGPVPRGIYLDRRGAKLRAIFKFPALSQAIVGEDLICPCLQIRNAYDGTGGIILSMGAFRFVCTNLAVGGGGVFAGGFVSIHAGEIPIEEMAAKLADYLARFDQITLLYRRWSEERMNARALEEVLKRSIQGRFGDFREQMLAFVNRPVFDAYNRLTAFATREMRSPRTAFDLLERVNSAFQDRWPVVDGEVVSAAEESPNRPALVSTEA